MQPNVEGTRTRVAPASCTARAGGRRIRGSLSMPSCVSRRRCRPLMSPTVWCGHWHALGRPQRGSTNRWAGAGSVARRPRMSRAHAILHGGLEARGRLRQKLADEEVQGKLLRTAGEPDPIGMCVASQFDAALSAFDALPSSSPQPLQGRSVGLWQDCVLQRCGGSPRVATPLTCSPSAFVSASAGEFSSCSPFSARPRVRSLRLAASRVEWLCRFSLRSRAI